MSTASPIAARNRLRAALSAVLLILLSATGIDAAELYMFGEPGCPWCKRWHAEVGPGYARSSEGRRAPLRELDLADASKTGVAFLTPVNFSPTFVLVENDREVGRITGYPGADFFWGMMGELIAKLDGQNPRPEPSKPKARLPIDGIWTADRHDADASTMTGKLP